MYPVVVGPSVGGGGGGSGGFTSGVICLLWLPYSIWMADHVRSEAKGSAVSKQQYP